MSLSNTEEEDIAFVQAQEDSIRAAPVFASGRSNYLAYVVYNGRKMGVFETWYVLNSIVSCSSRSMHIGALHILKLLNTRAVQSKALIVLMRPRTHGTMP